MKRHVFHPEATEEYAGAVEFYRGVDPALGVRFYAEGAASPFDVRCSMFSVRCSFLFPIYERFDLRPDFAQGHCALPVAPGFDPPARRHFSPDFPYAMIYLEQADLIWIVATMHMKREPGYWRRPLG